MMFIDQCNSSVDDFEILKVLGQGSFGKVFLVKKLTTPDKGTYYAMKVIKKSNLKIRDRLRTQMERNILAAIDHPFIVRLFYAFQNIHKLYLVLEFLRGGDLFTRLSKELMFTENDVKFYLAELALGVDHLHGLGIIYRDLKPENILLDKEGHIKLIDFGLCKEAMYDESAQRAYSFCGTVEYMAPEVVNRLGHGPAADWWSYGVLMYEMLTGRLPFQGVNRRDTMERILREKLQMPSSLSMEAQILLRALFKRNPCNRLGFGGLGLDQLKSMRFFRDIHWTDLYNRRISPPFKPTCARIEDACYFDPQFTSRPAKDSEMWSDSPRDRSAGPDLFPGFDYVAPPKLSCVSSYEGSFDEDDGVDSFPSYCMKTGKILTVSSTNSGVTSSSMEEAVLSPFMTHIVSRAFTDEYELDHVPFIGSQWHFCTRRTIPAQQAAVKIIPVNKKEPREELKILKELQNCSNVIKLLEVYENNGFLYVVAERPEGGSLLDRVRMHHRLSESEARPIIMVIAQIILAMHSRQIVHFDLRPSILHFKESTSFSPQSLVLCDFELAKHIPNPDLLSPLQSDLMNRKVDTTSFGADLWSLGVILFTLLSGKAPFGPCSFRLPRGTQNSRLIVDLYRPEWSAVSQSAKNLLKWLLEIDPTNRPSIKQVLAHAWISTETPTTAITTDTNQQRPRGTASSGTFVDLKQPIKKLSGSVGNSLKIVSSVLTSPAPSNPTLTVKRPSLTHMVSPIITVNHSSPPPSSSPLVPAGLPSSSSHNFRSALNHHKSTSRSSYTSAVTVVLNRRNDSAEGGHSASAASLLANRTAV